MRSDTFPPLTYEDFEDFFYEEDDGYWEDEELMAEGFDWPYDPELFEPDYEDDDEFYEPLPDELIWSHVYLVLAVIVIILFGAGLLTAFTNNQTIVENIPAQSVDLGGRPLSLEVDNPTAVFAPYKEYNLTQGLHGQSYGHLAIDLAAGRGEPIISPINGFVTDYYIDEYNNTTLIIENEVYQVTMLHGDFNVSIDEKVRAGQVVGTEGNNGYTMDFFGNLCYGRVHCGNHTHLNIYDKRIQANVNPLNLIQ